MKIRLNPVANPFLHDLAIKLVNSLNFKVKNRSLVQLAMVIKQTEAV